MRTSQKVRVLAALGTLSGVVWAGTFASFSDTATAGANTFTAGTLDMVVGGDADDAVTFTALSMANMKPGDTSYAELTVANVGSLDFTYGMTTSATNGDDKELRNKLVLGVKAVPMQDGCDANTYTAGTAVAAEGPLAATAFSTRALAKQVDLVPTIEKLCFKVTFPGTADDNAYQGAATTATFTFTASAGTTS